MARLINNHTVVTINKLIKCRRDDRTICKRFRVPRWVVHDIGNGFIRPDLTGRRTQHIQLQEKPLGKPFIFVESWE